MQIGHERFRDLRFGDCETFGRAQTKNWRTCQSKSAQKLVTNMNLMSGWWQYRPEGLLRGWETGEQLQLQEEDD